VTFSVAHVSDLHVSEFGDTFHDRLRVVKRSANVVATDVARFEIVWQESGWRVFHERGKRPSKIALVDPDGYAHPVPSLKEGGGVLDPVERAATKAFHLEARRATTLAKHVPSPGALQVLFEGTPRNSNVRLLRAVHSIEESNPDAVIITGDVTDDGVGWDLVESAFARWKDKGRLFVIPGNHDLYLFPLRGSGRPRPTADSKRAAWKAFAARIGLELHASGGWVRHVPEAGAVFVGLDSCARPQRRFFRHNGAIGPAQLAWLREVAAQPAFKAAKHRLVMLHHHVVPLPHGVGRRAPSEIGMRLDDARSAAEIFDEIGATAVLHGHRHVSEQRQPAGTNFTILASPSLTLGCRSGDDPSFWRIELDDHFRASRVRVPVQSVEQDDDPPESLAAPATDSVVDLLSASDDGDED